MLFSFGHGDQPSGTLLDVWVVSQVWWNSEVESKKLGY